MNLSGQQRKKLHEALINAFPDQSSLEQMVSFELDKNLNAIAGGANLKEVVFNLIQRAEAENWIKDLVSGARKSNPRNKRLHDIAAELFRISDSKSGDYTTLISKKKYPNIHPNILYTRNLCFFEYTFGKGDLL
ncbi:effector-associated domain EAD1-containing protein [Moorena producens]|uniref:effector-associated domain EAD1-containing protein n=1 Tax=Moorena producens TaxID=1155739 RepID=UPI003C711994